MNKSPTAIIVKFKYRGLIVKPVNRLSLVVLYFCIVYPPVWKNGYAEFWRQSYKSIYQSIKLRKWATKYSRMKLMRNSIPECNKSSGTVRNHSLQKTQLKLQRSGNSGMNILGLHFSKIRQTLNKIPHLDFLSNIIISQRALTNKAT